MRSRRLRHALCAALPLTVATPGAASAHVTIGPPMTSFDTVVTCPATTCAAVHQFLPGGFNVKSTITGVIVRWRVSGTGGFQLFTGTYTDAANDVFKRGLATPVRVMNSLLDNPPWIEERK